MKKIAAVLLCAVLGASFVGCSQEKTSGTEVRSGVSVAYGTEKILQSYGDYTEAKERVESAYLDSFEITAFQNEYESRQLIIVPEKNVNSFDIRVSDFRSGSDVLSKETFDVRYEYYHMVETIYDYQSEMVPGMYPDALLPLATAQNFGLDKIAAGENQGVYITVNVPDEQKPGTYTGTIDVILDGVVSETVDAKINVLDYRLPDSVSLKSSFQLQRGYLIQGELDNTPEMYNKYIDAMQEFRISPAQINAFTVNNVAYEDSIRMQVKDSVKAAQDDSYSAYCIWTYGKYDAAMGENTLDQEKFETSLKAYVDKSIETNVNLFKKAYVYMGDIIDEPDVSGKYDLCNYVCRQYDETLQKVVQYAIGKGANEEVVEDLRNLSNVVTGMYSEFLPDVGCYCPTADDFSSTARLEEYKSLRDQGKNYWWYTCTLPKIPYPTHHIDDSGVSSRVMSWMAKEFEVDGFLMWETAYYKVAMGNQVIYGRDLYDNVHRWQDAYGDGFYFYPGRVFDIDGPVPALRLYTIRDGMEDYEALYDLEKKYAQAGTTYGAEISADGVLGQLYSEMYSSSQVLCGSKDIENAKIRLGQLLLLEKQGVYISDFAVLSNGRITANIYAPDGTEVYLNGQKLTFTGGKCVINGVYDTFTLEAGGAKVELTDGKASSVSLVNESLYAVYDVRQQASESAVIANETYGGSETTKVVLGANDSRISVNASALTLDKGSKTLIWGLYLDSSEKREVNIVLYGNNRTASLDTVYLKPGYNEIRLDCLQFLNWGALRKGESIFFNFAEPGDATVYFTSLCMVK